MARIAYFKTIALMGVIIAGTAGCPEGDSYDLGFTIGFARDDYYWMGYDDSYDTLEYDPVYYQGGDIPNVTTPEYDRGYYDGLWYAYNDGYFVCYDYAFTIGFSEGYDAAFYPGYLAFLATDEHVENDNGGWGDGYNDGFSEGRIFGAADYEAGWDFDWFDAMTDYRSGTDLYFEEVDVGTGSYGPVILYEYGWDPLSGAKAATVRTPRAMKTPNVRILRAVPSAKADDLPPISYRTFPAAQESALNVRPTTTARSSRTLTLTTTWLERINAYRDAME